MRVAIVGCGLIGQKRAEALGDAHLLVCVDVIQERAQKLAQAYGAHATSDWESAVACEDVDVVIVSTINNALAPVTLAAVNAGKHVLVEKPAARSTAELEPVMQAAARAGVQVRVGFNHRYHPALRKARDLFAQGVLGEMMFVRGRYGHGGRPGYDQEWRAQPALSGGGELMDQGVHLIDLARLFLGDFSRASGFAQTYFWNMPVDDNAFLLLKTASDRAAFLHVSCTEWKNLFSFEIYGHDAKIHVEGLGGSYGIERLSLYEMSPQMGAPETTIWEFPGGDDSFKIEFQEFLEDIRLTRAPAANLKDARAALEIVETIYQQSDLQF